MFNLNNVEIKILTPAQAYLTARIPGADIKKCQKIACKEACYAYHFARYVPGANIQQCIEACKGTEYEASLNQYLMEKALL